MINKGVLLALIFYCAGLQASQDRIIQVNKKGDLIGLPTQYLPAHIDMENNTLRIAKNKLRMPTCLSKYFAFNEPYTLKVTSSWSHQRSSLPPYINFKIEPTGRDYAYSILFGLEGLALLEAQVITYPDDVTRTLHTVALSDVCTKAIHDGYVN